MCQKKEKGGFILRMGEGTYTAGTEPATASGPSEGTKFPKESLLARLE